MLLKLLYDNDTQTQFYVRTVWMCSTHGMDKIYFETDFDDLGKGTFIPLCQIKTWVVTWC